MEDCRIILPPGFQFNPTDEELTAHFLYRKASNLPGNPSIIPELDLCSTDPWELNDKALIGRNQWYFFSQVMENRATEKGHWEELDMDDHIVTNTAGKSLGFKKYFVFYIDHQVPKKLKTSWLMEEYHLCKENLQRRYGKKGRRNIEDINEWMLCRVHDANSDDSQGINFLQSNGDGVEVDELSILDEVFLSMEDNDEDEISFPD